MKKLYLISEKKIRTIAIFSLFFFVLLVNKAYSQTLSANCAGASTFNVNQEYTGLTVSDNVINDPSVSNCNGQTISRDGWLKFDAISSETVIKATAPSRNLMLYAYSGTCGSLTYLNCENTTTTIGVQTETMVLSTTPGTTYYIRIGNATNNNMSVTSLFILTNDKCSDAITLTSNSSCITTTGSTLGARDNNETGDCTTGTEKAVWYQFQAVATTHVVTVDGIAGFDAVIGAINTCGSSSIPTGGSCTDVTADDGIETMSLTGLTIGNYYKIQVYDFNGDETANGFTICVTHTTPCTTPTAQPTSFTSGTISSTSIAATFTAASPAPNKYLVLVSTSNSAPSPGPVNGTTYSVGNTISGSTVVSVSNSTSFTASSLNGNTRYYFYIYSYNDTSCSGGPVYNTTNPLTGNAITCPALPNSVTTGSITSSSFTLNWATPTGGSASSLNYTVQVTTDAGFTTNVSGSPFTTSSLTQNVTGLSAGTTYYYRVRANGSCSSNWVTGSVTTSFLPCTTPIAQPTSIVFSTTTTNSISASFTAALPAPNKYLVVRSTSATAPSPGPVNGTSYSLGNNINGATVISNTSSISFTSNGLTGNTRYYYYIYSFNDTSCTGGPLYNIISPLSGSATTCPAVPNSVTTSAITGTSFTVNWTAPTGGSASAITYTVQVTTDAGYTTDVTGSPFTTSALTQNITGLSGGTTYYYRIRANNSCSSNWVTGSITTLLPNDDCSGAIALTVSTTCSYLSSTNVGATSSSGVPAPGCASYTNRDVWFSAVVPSTGTLNVDLQAGSMTDSGMAFYSGTCGSLTLLECDDDDGAGNMSYISMVGLTPGQTIYIRVWQYGGGSGTFGICATTPSCPSPSDLFANILSTTSASVYWTASTPPAANGYQYYYNTTGTVPTGGTTPTGTTAPGVVGVTLTGLTTGQIYYFWVRSDCGGGDNSTWFGPTNFSPCAVGDGQGTTTLECPEVVAGGSGLGGLDPTAVVCSSSTCSNLEATYPILNSTSNYTISSIPYDPPYQYSCLQNPVSVNVDDVWSQTINLPFNFCFFGNNYNKCLIGSNGNITFDFVNNTPGGYNAWSFNTSLPSTSLFKNTIFGVYHDIDPSVGGEVGWELVTLNTGCRALVASWNNIPMFSTTCNSILYTGMIVLYENTNIIDVYIKEKNVCSTWNDGNAIVGIQNADGTTAVVAPSRNGLDANWTVSNEAWRFTPSGPSITSFKWYEGNGTTGPVVGTTNNITVCPAVTTTYTAEVTYNLCSGNQLKYTDNTTVTVTGNKIWTGSVDSDWNKANNWSPSGVPTNLNCVIIPDTANDPIISGTNYKAYGHNMDVKTNASLQLNSSNNLTITDFARINGTFNMKNSSNFIQINDGAVNTGNLSMERSTNVRQYDYVYWSSPVASFSSASISPTTPSWAIYKWEPATSNTNGGQGYWTAGSETMVLGKGYIVRGPSGYSTTTPSTYTATFTGVPNNGIIQPTISRGSYTGAPYSGTNGITITNLDDNWNLIGNPYPSAINANTFLTNNTNINGTVRLWTHGNPISTSNTNPFYASYLYNYSVNDYVTYNGTGSTPPGFNGKIGAGQAFFVLMNDGAAGSQTVTFNNSLRSDSYDNSQFYRTTSEATIESLEKNRIWLSLVNSSNIAATTLVGYIQDATNDEDRLFDGVWKPGTELGIYSKIEDKTMIIQGRTLPFNQYDTVPIGVTIPSTGVYNIAINQLDGLFEDASQNIYIEDTVENVIHDLRQNPYSFTASTGNYPNRFVLRYTTSALGIDDNNTVKVYAYISNNVLNIQTEDSIKEVSVYDVSGKLVNTYKASVSNNKIEEAFPYSNGVYVAKIKLENGQTVSRKLLK